MSPSFKKILSPPLQLMMATGLYMLVSEEETYLSPPYFQSHCLKFRRGSGNVANILDPEDNICQDSKLARAWLTTSTHSCHSIPILPATGLLFHKRKINTLFKPWLFRFLYLMQPSWNISMPQVCWYEGSWKKRIRSIDQSTYLPIPYLYERKISHMCNLIF